MNDKPHEQQISVTLKRCEIEELASTCQSMIGRLLKDRHVHPQVLNDWRALADKLTMALVRS